eukprot:4258664-Alexandrium_andersonii.AAC.1
MCIRDSLWCARCHLATKQAKHFPARCEGAPGGSAQALADARARHWRRRKPLLEWHRATPE